MHLARGKPILYSSIGMKTVQCIAFIGISAGTLEKNCANFPLFKTRQALSSLSTELAIIFASSIML